MAALRILGFAGSLRAGSYNRALLRAAVEVAPEDLELEIFDLRGLPLYDGDVELEGDPAPVAAFKAAIRGADGLLMATPEYNHGVPGVMKNAVDWASRPPRDSALNGKPVGLIGASTGMTGSARGQTQLRQAFEFTNSFCMPQPEILVARAHEKFDEGRLIDDSTRLHLRRYLEALAAWTRRFSYRENEGEG